MRGTPQLFALAILAAAAGLAQADAGRRAYDRDAARYLQVEVADPYLDLHSGPGRGYPVLRVIGRGEHVEVLFRRTDWFRVRDEHDREGWAHRDQLRETLLASGDKLAVEDVSKRDYDHDPWEAGALTGNFGGGNVNTVYVGYALNANLGAEIATSQTLGHASNSIMAVAGLTHAPFPEWRLSPFVELGTGVMRIQPKATIVSPANRTEQVGYYGVGARFYLSRRLILRADYRSYVIFTKLNSNEDRNEWKAGFAFFF
jgi:hypothetical protein